MALERLGSSIHDALKKLFRVAIVDEAVVKELVHDLQRALLQADVNVQLVLDISRRIEERALKEKVPPGVSRKEHVIKVVYEELTRFLGEKQMPLEVEPGKKKVIMLVGIQGSGKTTASVKLSRYLQKRGIKSAIVCTDTYRPGALAQLEQLAKRINIPVFGNPEEKSAVKIAMKGLEQFKDNKEVIIIDTAGRHKDEKSLIQEMKMLEKAMRPDEVILVIDGTIGQQAALQAKAFHEATPIGSILVAKLDGSARGGGALSAVAATKAPIKFISVGEKIEDIEPFVPSRFVGRLLGMGDLESLLEKVREAEIKVPEKKAKAFLSGKFTLTDMYEQFEALKGMGPFKKLLGMLPGMSYNVPDEMMEMAQTKLEKWRVIIQSMTSHERDNPKMFNSSRIHRVARGSGTSEKEVKELLKQYFMMKRMIKSFRRKKMPFFGGKQFPPVK